MDLGGLGWSLQTIIGAALFVIVVGWVVLNNRSSRRQDAETDAATRDLYREEDRAHRDEDDNVP